MIKKRILNSLATVLLVVASSFAGAFVYDYAFVKNNISSDTVRQFVNEESAVVETVEKYSSSVVTVSIKTPRRRTVTFDIFRGFVPGFEGGEEQDIGSGFIVEGGYVVTNKHVVDSEGEYKVITQDGEEHEVTAINKDPSNDLAILEVTNIESYKSIPLGDSDSLKVGQFVIAIGTALGEFRHTVTTGVVSGLGRGITAGSVFEGYVERLDNVIQTDAAINPGNSGGPLLNSKGEVIGVNVAVASGAQNIGFALPINIVKEGLDEFNENGQFATRPFLGVEHTMISREAAILNELPQGAYVSNVLSGSAADNAGIKVGDIITKFNGKSVADADDGLAELVGQQKVGDTVSIEVWRDGEKINLTAKLTSSESN